MTGPLDVASEGLSNELSDEELEYSSDLGQPDTEDPTDPDTQIEQLMQEQRRYLRDELEKEGEMAGDYINHIRPEDTCRFMTINGRSLWTELHALREVEELMATARELNVNMFFISDTGMNPHNVALYKDIVWKLQKHGWAIEHTRVPDGKAAGPQAAAIRHQGCAIVYDKVATEEARSEA